MIVLTKEKREDLLAYGIAMIADAKVNGNQIYLPDKYIYLMKIALAALTAEPVLHAVDSDVEDKMHTALCNEHEDGSYPLFTAPPVPEIKLPDRDKLPGWARNHEDSLDWYESEIKRLNGLGE